MRALGIWHRDLGTVGRGRQEAAALCLPLVTVMTPGCRPFTPPTAASPRARPWPHPLEGQEEEFPGSTPLLAGGLLPACQLLLTPGGEGPRSGFEAEPAGSDCQPESVLIHWVGEGPWQAGPRGWRDGALGEKERHCSEAGSEQKHVEGGVQGSG